MDVSRRQFLKSARVVWPGQPLLRWDLPQSGTGAGAKL
jgi:hypothetical protein